MSRLLTRTVRLLKVGAVAGAAVGIGRLILRRRRQAEASESSWPTIAETAAQNGQPVDDRSDDEASPGDAETGSEPEESSEGSDGDADKT